MELGGAVAVIVCLLQWRQPPTASYDAGLYYVQTMRWAVERPVVPGLANLHGRLGYNSAWLITAAAVEVPGLRGWASSFANLLPTAMAAAGAAVALRRVALGPARFGDVALALALPVVGQSVGGMGVRSPDHVAAIVTYLAFALWVRALDGDDATFTAEARPAFILSTLAITIKLSAAPALILALAASTWRRKAVTTRWLLSALIPSSAIAFAWTARSLLLSGCIVYPAAWSCVAPLPWAVPRAMVRAEAEWIGSWARMPNGLPPDVLGHWDWLETWARRLGERPDIHLFIGIATVGLLLWATSRRADAAVLLPFAAALVGLGFVFLTAPEPRFGFGFLHAVGLVPLGFGLSRRTWTSPLARGLVACAIAAAAVYWASATGQRRPWNDAAASRPPPTVPTIEQVTRWGFRARVPLESDQCWAIPIPCTPHLDQSLRERGGILAIDPAPTPGR